ncbi:MAG: integrase arm-type DNA-binding domain-containing protein [Rhodanobacter sp.]
MTRLRGLTDAELRKTKPQGKPFNLYDSHGLYLTIAPSGGKWWRLKFRFAGRERRMGLGSYPEVTLAEARERTSNARAHLRDSRDPSIERQAERRRTMIAAANTFVAIADEWMKKRAGKLAASSQEKNAWLLELVANSLGPRPIADIKAPDVLAALRKIEARGRHETARRTKQCIGMVFRYAIATGRAERDPSADLRGALTPPTSKPRAAVTAPADVAGLLRAIEAYVGQPTTHAALRLAPLVFVRPRELRAAEWCEFDLAAAEWRIPAERMKMREEHIVPLARQAVVILRELQPLTGGGRYVFPSLRSHQRPMSENTINAALRRMGFDKETMTGHGFRAMASTRLNEMGWNPDVIERQLAHAERNKVRAVYNRAQYMDERRKMLQQWADYLDMLKQGGNVVLIRKVGR